MSNFQSEEYLWKPNFSNYTKFKQKTFNYIQRPLRNFHFEVAVWRYFSVAVQLIWHSLLYNVQSSIRGVPMETKLLKLHQIQTKNLELYRKTFQKFLFWSCCVTSFFRCFPGNLALLALQCAIFNQKSTHGSQTCQIKPKLKGKTSN